MDSPTCKHCRRRSRPEIRCHRCQRVGNVKDGLYSVGSRSWSLEIEKKKTSAKIFCMSVRDKFSGTNTQHKPIESPTRCIITLEPPPRGKRAFLCAVTYKKQKCELKGTAQDVKNMRNLLVDQFSFPNESILILAEEESFRPPTRKNIEDALQWLVRGIRAGDSLVFYFSGHGLRQRDLDDDEIDGFDEAICPVDFQTNGMILDNYINKTIVGPLIPGVTLNAIVDSCHSGTVLDLPHVYNISTGQWDNNRPPSGAYKGTSGGTAICFSACEDYQLAADTSVSDLFSSLVQFFLPASRDGWISFITIIHHLSGLASVAGFLTRKRSNMAYWILCIRPSSKLINRDASLLVYAGFSTVGYYRYFSVSSQLQRIIGKTREMATRRVSCRWCGRLCVVPLQTQTLCCPACGRFTTFQSNYNGHLPYGASGNGNFMTSNTYLTNPNYAAPAHGRPQRPVNAGGVYPIPSPLPTPPAHGRKRALLCGITYKGHQKSLKGSINDVLYMKRLLIERFGFPVSSILLLTEEGDYSKIPTKKNIRAALRWLVQGCQFGDTLVFHYSGHGARVRDLDGDELDGYDESLLPVDYETEGRILDDEINETIVRPLPKGATLTSIVDSCFCGTFLDLPNVCRIKRDGYYKWEDHCVPHAYKGTSGGYAACISACDDHQNSGDTTAFTGAPTGALTYSFVQTLEQKPRLTYADLLITMHKKISGARQEVGLNSDAPHLSQEPQLSSSHRFDIYKEFFTL